MSTMEIVALAGSVVLLLFSAVLAVAETAFTHLGRARAEAIDNARSGKTKDKTRDDDGNGNGADETDPAHAGVLVGLLARRGQVLNPVLFLVLVCHLSIATIVAVVAYEHWGRSAVLVALGIELVVLYVAAEAAPKTWALQHTDVAAVRVAPAGPGPGRARRRCVGSCACSSAWPTSSCRARAARRARRSPRTSCWRWPTWRPRRRSSRPASGPSSSRSSSSATPSSARSWCPRTDMVTVGDDFRVDDVIEVVIAQRLQPAPGLRRGRSTTSSASSTPRT